jgi:Ig-like domain-containing protein
MERQMPGRHPIDRALSESSPPTAGRNGAVFVAITRRPPLVLVAGRQYDVALTMRNSGTTVWHTEGAQPYRLGAHHPRDTTRWGIGRIDVPSEVHPGADATFTFAIVAPTAPGRYHFQWRMVQDGVGWFGQATADLVVTVAVAPDGAPLGRARSMRYRKADPVRDSIIGMRTLLHEAASWSY